MIKLGTMNQLSTFPPPPELGWYPEDIAWCEREGIRLLTQSTPPAHNPVLGLHNRANGQEIMLAGNTLLGRKPSLEVSNAILDAHRGEHVDVATLVDSTRTVSRNHAFVTFSDDGIARIQDLGSLNGTFIISDGDESSVVEGTAAVIDASMTLRVGDEFYEIERVPQN